MKPKTGSRVNWKPVADKAKKEERAVVKRRDATDLELEPATSTAKPKPKPKAKPVAKKPLASPPSRKPRETEAPAKPVAKKLVKAKVSTKPARVEKRTKPKKEDLFVIHVSDTKKTRVVLLRSPAEGERVEMIGLRQQFRREGDSEWHFAKVGISMVSDVEVLKALRAGCDALIAEMEDE